MNNVYYLKIKIDESNNASSKAVNDCNKILEKNGAVPFTLNIKRKGNKFIKKINNFIELNKLYSIKSWASICVPHPIYLNKKYIEILCKAKQKKNLKLIFLIHDLDSLRKMFPDAEEDFIYIDNMMFKNADFIIAHNSKMIGYLEERGVDKNKIYNLGIFDYLISNFNSIKQVEFSKTLNIAGNLDVTKCKYIKELNNLNGDVKLNLFGLNFDENVLNSPFIQYKGSFPADEIPNQLTEGFGLVWDGCSIDSCTGNTGDYLRYNNPHKLSLYLASGMPVVIWKEAAEAKFVEENHVGILVNSINDFSNAFDQLSESDFEIMKNNARLISHKLRNGDYLSNVYSQIVNEFIN